ncbi:MAG: DNA polymerase I [Chitinispirillaceae bacterium]|nr:DNA polymerase I [Chitinispirillaceae bacterium]
MDKRQLFLIDGHALIYRSYFAFIRNPLMNSKGQNTSAVFGFANYIIKLLETYTCSYCAVVLDSSKPTFRHEMYTQYKANRQEMPDDLKSQIPIINEVIRALNIPVICEDGLEADDLIGTIARMAENEGFEVFLVTKDKDLMQLISPNVKMLAPEGTGTLQSIGENDVLEKMGVPPAKIVDYLALVGDSSDNIPGVPGIGPKNAIKILELCGSVDALLENSSILGNAKLIQKIEENRNDLKLSKELATLRTSSSPIDLETFKRGSVNGERCKELFRDLEFHSLIRKTMFGEPDAPDENIITINMEDHFEEVTEKLKAADYISIYFFLSCEDVINASVLGASFSINSNMSYTLTMQDNPGEQLLRLKDVFESEKIRKTGHDIKSIIQILKRYEITLRGISFDTMIAAYLLDPGKRDYSIDILCGEWLKKDLPPVLSLLGEGKNKVTRSQLPVKTIADYCAKVSSYLYQMKDLMMAKLDSSKLVPLLESIELPVARVLAEMELHGILINKELLGALSKEYGELLNHLSDDVFRLAGETFNLNSPKQIGEILFEKLQIPGSKKTKNGSHSTNAEILETLAPDYPVIGKILEYRELQKLCSTYIDALPMQINTLSARVHTTFNQTIAATGRLSSTNPNLQNIPIRSEEGRRIREAFVAQEGFTLISADYSQIELRILAHLSEDPFLIEAFRNDKDIHTLTASAIFSCFPEMVTADMRRAAKTINFGLMYGMGPMNLSRQLSVSFSDAKKFIETYFSQFPKIKTYMECSIQKVRDCGYSETMFGRRRFLPDINAANRVIREAAERTAVNTPVQGAAADIIKLAMISVDKEIKEHFPSARMLLQVHDELIFEVPLEIAESLKESVIAKMSTAAKLLVPLKVEAGIAQNWRFAH